MSNIENINDHMAYACKCGSVRFALLRSGGIECHDCADKLNAYWAEEAEMEQYPDDAVVEHPDDAAVDAFAAAMKTKLAIAREKGRGGWQEADAGVLSGMLRHHVDKGDPLDVANFCMFLWSLGHGIAKWSGPSELPRHARPKFDRGSFDAAGWVSALADCVKTRGVTWKDVAEATGVNETTLSRMKSGDRQPDAASLAALSAWAGINPANYCGESQKRCIDCGESIPSESSRLICKSCLAFSCTKG